MPGSPVLVRYADDLVALCHTREQAEQVKARLAEWLAPRGLAFNEDKTRIVHLDEGFDFLGFNVRRYRRQAADQAEQGGRQADPGTARRRDARPARGQRDGGASPALNPIIRGWAAYYRSVVSSEAFAALDDYVWKLTYKWASCSPPEQAEALDRRPVLRQVQQVQAATGGCSATATAAPTCRKFAWTKIVRHRLVKGTASPDDPALADYWAERRRSDATPAGPGYTCACCRRSTAAARSAGACCCTPTSQPHSPDEWEQWLQRHPQGDHASTAIAIDGRRHAGRTADTVSCTPTAAGAPDAAGSRTQHFCPPATPSGLA